MWPERTCKRPTGHEGGHEYIVAQHHEACVSPRCDGHCKQSPLPVDDPFSRARASAYGTVVIAEEDWDEAKRERDELRADMATIHHSMTMGLVPGNDKMRELRGSQFVAAKWVDHA